MSFSFFLLMISLIIFCITLIFVILLQNPQSGGSLSSTFGGTKRQMFGIENTNKFMDSVTWILFFFVIITIFFSNIITIDPNRIDDRTFKTPKSKEKPNIILPIKK